MTSKNKVKWQRILMDMLIAFFQKIWHSFKDFCHFCEDFMIGIVFRYIVNWYDKRKGQYNSPEQINNIKNASVLLKQIIKEVQSKQNLKNLKKQVEDANKTISELNEELTKLKEKFNKLN